MEMERVLRITPEHTDQATTILRVEGKIDSSNVDELRRECEARLGQGRKVELDLRWVSFADGEGIRALRELEERGIRTRNASLFLSELLDERDRASARKTAPS